MPVSLLNKHKGQTLSLIASHPDAFKAAGAFSSAPAYWVKDELPQIKGQLKRFRLLYVSCGNWDFLLETSRDFHELLDKLKIRHVYVEGEGGHIWSFWQRSLVDFLSKFNAS